MPRAPKRQKDEEEDDALDDSPKGSAPKAKRAKKPQEVIEVSPELQDLWSVQEPSLLYRNKARGADGSIHTIAPGKKIAAFDFDGTLVVIKSNSKFPRGPDDWKLFSPKAEKVIKGFHAAGHKIVVFSNQKGVGKQLAGKASRTTRQRAENFITKLGLPDITVLMATQEDDFRKPKTGMWKFFVETLNGGVEPDKSQSFFVGDAAGRMLDFADSDKVFAKSIGIDFKTPEDVFGEGAKKDMSSRPGTEAGPNTAMAPAFVDLAAVLEGNGDVWPARAARKAADIIRGYPAPIASGKEMGQIKGIGKSTVNRIDDFLANGTLKELGGDGGGGGGDGAGGSASKPVDADRAMAAAFLD